MNNATNAPQSSAARGLFTDKNRSWLLAQVVGEPTGIIVNIGGVEFDLLPLPTAEGEQLLGIVEDVSAAWKSILAGESKDADIFALLGDKLPAVLAMTKRILRESAGPETDEALFDEWFSKTRFIPMLRALAPGVLRANGFANIADRFDKNPQMPASTSQIEAATPAPEAATI